MRFSRDLFRDLLNVMNHFTFTIHLSPYDIQLSYYGSFLRHVQIMSTLVQKKDYKKWVPTN